MLPSLGIDSWKEEAVSVLAAKILNITPKPLVLIDGKGGSGKTSFAAKLAGALDASIVSTDDVAWWADPIHWDDELLSGIIKPWLNGEDVAYTPSGWIKKNRDGFIKADSSKALIVEGSGACRKTLRKLAAYSVWIDTEPDISRERVIKRDLANGENGGTLESVTEFTDHWDSVVDPFLLEEEAWKYVNIIVSGYYSDLGSDTVMYSPSSF
jgi:uridine kinase